MNEGTLAYLITFFLALLISLFMVPVMQRLAFRFNIVDVPGGRKLHLGEIPCLGGVAVYLAFLVVVLGSLIGFYFLTRFKVSFQLVPEWIHQIPLIKKVSPKLFGLLGGATAILFIGLIDDIIGVKFDYRLKFLGEALIAFGMTLLGIQLEFLPVPFLNKLITVLWIVGITNALNLLDNMDGLSAGVAYICAMFFFFIAARHQQFFVGLIYLALSGGLLGFLYYNFNPAKIYLGDAGALFVGFLLSTLTVLQSFETPKSMGYFPIFMPVIILSLPIFDTARVVLIRWYEKRPLFQGDRRHLSHRLVEMGMTHRQAVLTVYAMTFALGLGSLILDEADLFSNWVNLVQAGSVILTFSLIMAFTRKGG